MSEVYITCPYRKFMGLLLGELIAGGSLFRLSLSDSTYLEYRLLDSSYPKRLRKRCRQREILLNGHQAHAGKRVENKAERGTSAN